METCKGRKLWCFKTPRSDIMQEYSNISLQLKFYFQISFPKNSTVHPLSVVKNFITVNVLFPLNRSWKAKASLGVAVN